MNDNLVAYYHARAAEYDVVYLNPPEQPDLAAANRIFQALFAQRTVLELACGTGYWTEKIAQTATSVYATDINDAMLKNFPDRDFVCDKLSTIATDITFTTLAYYWVATCRLGTTN